MNFLHHYNKASRPAETCVVGSGGFGRSFLAQCLRSQRVRCRVAVDLSTDIAAQALQAVGIAPTDIARCDTRDEAQAAWTQGRYIAAGSVDVVLGLPLDLLVEATGHPEAGARHARLAIDAGWHVALASKEADSVVGPELARRAQARGRVVTPVDGDQPSLLIGLITWAQTLALDIVAAGKSSEYDFVFDPASETISSNGRQQAVPGFGALWTLGERAVPALVAARAQACAALPQRAVPDLCELQVVANATGLKADLAALHAPIARPLEVPTVMAPTNEGGLLLRSGTLDVFHCLRLADELSFAGGVYVVVACHDDETWELLHGKGHVLSRDRRRALMYIPRHLLGLEAATSVLDAVVHGESSGAQQPRPVLDLIARATQALPAGTRLAMGGHHHTVDGVAAELVDAAPLTTGQPMPFYLAANGTLLRDIAAGEAIAWGDVALPSDSELLALRQAQDAHFFPDR